MQPAVLTRRETAKYLGIALSTLARMEAEGLAPPRIRLLRRSGYRVQTLDQWLADRERDDQRAAARKRRSRSA